VTNGTFSHDELIALCASLEPLTVVLRDAENATATLPPPCFASATCYARHPNIMHGFLVPSSLWAADVSNFGLPHCAFPQWHSADTAPDAVPRHLGDDLTLDSFAILGGSSGGTSSKPAGRQVPVETFVLYCDATRNAMLWVRTLRSLDPRKQPVRWPPEPGSDTNVTPGRILRCTLRTPLVQTVNTTVRSALLAFP
jgi:hypothetical protein